MTERFRDAFRPPLRRRLLIGAAFAAGLTGWTVEMGTSSASIGAFAWTVPPVMAAVWLTAPSRRDARAEAVALARIFALLVVLGHATILIAGMHPSHVACVVSAALRLAVLAPLVLLRERLSRALTARWAARRGGTVAAAIVGQGVPFLAWLPVLLLAVESHRPQGRLDPEEIGIRWPHEPVALRGSGGTELAGLWFENPARKGAVLLVHGIGAEKTQFLPSVEGSRKR